MILLKILLLKNFEMDEKMSVGRPVRGRVHGRKERVLSSDSSADA